MKTLKPVEVENLFKLIDKGDRKKTRPLNRAKEFMAKYPNHELSKKIRNWIFKNIKKAFFNPNLKRALEIPDEYYFTKKVEIYRYLPFIENGNNFAYYFGALFGLTHKEQSNPINLYMEIKKFCDKYYKNYFPNSLFEKIIKNIEKYEMNFFADKESLMVPYDDPDLLGKYGECSVTNWLKEYIGRTTHVPSECYGGFGFDVLYDDPVNDKEVLIEVKTTLQSFHDENTLFISNAEERTKRKTDSLPKTEYVLIRVYVDDLTCEKTFLILYWDKERKVFYNDDNPYYRIEYKRRKKNLSNKPKNHQTYSKTLILKDKIYEKRLEK